MKENKFIDKLPIIVIAILFLALNLILFITRSVAGLDEAWNYNLANQIVNRLVPYRDISMIVTPFSSYLMAIPLMLFENGLFTFRVFGAIFITAILILSFDILNKATKSKLFSFFVILLIEYIFLNNLTYDYNYVIVLLSLIIVDIEIRQSLKQETIENNKVDIIIGIIAGLAICTKQTIGIFIALAILIKIVLLCKNCTIKEKLSKIWMRIIGILIPVEVMCLYLIANDAVGDFISYTILGVREFTNSVSYFKLFENENIYIKIVSIFMPVFLVFSLLFFYENRKENKKFNIFKILIIYSIPCFIMLYPIADILHFLVSIYILMLAFAYFVFYVCKNINIKHIEKFKKNICIFIIVVLSVVLTINILKSMYSDINIYMTHEKSNLKHLEKLVVSDYLSEHIVDVTNKIDELSSNGDNVYLLDTEAVFYNFTEDRYFKDYDMLNKGNLGINGEDRIINQIGNTHNSYYLIREVSIQPNWQCPLKIINYIRNNFEYVDTIDVFDIYRKE